ncbi:MAG TPA: aminoglycoside 3-N-acetyltransferase [Anaerolineales bacterium]|nr:aminoglycoside 3-N-acetyltransferase [Anaerolineales bacterium]
MTLPHRPSRILADLRALGVAPGQTVMLHASVKAIGPVMGGPNTIVQSLFDALTPTGTLMMYAGWADIPDFIDELPADEQAAYRAEHPAFDPATARAVRDHSVLAEVLRTWPATRRSLNPEASMIANGADAEWLTADHALDYGYGVASPLARLVERGGQVLLLGAPLDTITLLHHAEYHARLRDKRVVNYSCPVLQAGTRVWVDIEDFDTGEPHDAYSLEGVALAYLAEHPVPQSRVGDAAAYLFPAAPLVAFAVDWLEKHFGPVDPATSQAGPG